MIIREKVQMNGSALRWSNILAVIITTERCQPFQNSDEVRMELDDTA